jgi:hypothetical protein
MPEQQTFLSMITGSLSTPAQTGGRTRFILSAWLASQSIESLNSPNRVGGSNLTSPRKRNVADRSDRTSLPGMTDGFRNTM